MDSNGVCLTITDYGTEARPILLGHGPIIYDRAVPHEWIKMDSSKTFMAYAQRLMAKNNYPIGNSAIVNAHLRKHLGLEKVVKKDWFKNGF